MTYFRFPISDFVEAESFEQAKEKLLNEIQQVAEKDVELCQCTCLGFSHRHDCHLMKDVIPY